MAKIDTELWKKYKLGKLNRELTSEEQIEIDNCELAVNLLLPTKSFTRLYRKLQSEGWTSKQILNILYMAFVVPYDVIEVKIHEINTRDREITDEKGPKLVK